MNFKDRKIAPEPYFTAYSKVLTEAIMKLRFWIRYDYDSSQQRNHDLLDAIHNIPQLLNTYSDWFVHENIFKDLQRYDAKWAEKPLKNKSGGEDRFSLVDTYNDAISSIDT